MSLLTSFINPSFLLCLGIIALVGGLLYIQVESKAREQNHKISSMLSLVSSLADEVNTIKHVLQNNRPPIMNHVQASSNRLIDVSDGSDSESDSESESESEMESESDSESESEMDSDDETENDESGGVEIELDNSNNILDTIDSTIKVLKLDLGTVLNNTDDEHSSSSSDDLDDLESELSFDELPQDTESETISTYDLKTIQLTNLEDIATVVVDYKKMSVPMLRSVIKEKQLAADPSKLKKPELLKLLGF